MKSDCPGCKATRWVDSKYFGPTICPVCKGSGEIEDAKAIVIEGPNIVPIAQNSNASVLLGELEAWLLKQPGIMFGVRGATMNRYDSVSYRTNDKRGLVWTPTRGDNRIYLRKGSYSTIDSNNNVQYITGSGKPTWGGYPQYLVQNREDLEFAKKLVEYARHNL